MSDGRDLEGALSGIPEEPAAPRFREGLRESFVHGSLAHGSGGSAGLDGLDGQAAAATIEQLIAAQPAPPSAREEFRGSLRERFSRGELRGAQAGDSSPAPALVARRMGPVARLSIGGLACAAALWLVGLLLLPEREPWRVRRIEGSGPLLVDGREVETRDLSLVTAAFLDAEVFSTQGNRVDLIHDEVLVLRIQPNSMLDALRLDSGELRLGLAQGELYLKTREPHSGPTVLVDTPHMELVLVGTVLGVLADGETTCVCVARGQVEMRIKGAGATRACPEGSRHVVSADGDVQITSFADPGPAGGDHVGGLTAFAAEQF